MNRRYLSTNTSLLLFSLTAFFGYILGNAYFWLLISLFPVFLRFSYCFKKAGSDSIPWAVFIMLAYATSAISNSKTETYKFVFIYICFFSFLLIFENENKWQRLMVQLFWIFSAVNTIFVLLSLFIPDTILIIAQHLYNGEAFDMYYALFMNESYAGICAQTSAAAFFASIFMSFAVSNFFSGRQKTLNLLFVFLAVVGIFITKKRSFLLSNAIAIIITFILNTKFEKNAIEKIRNFLMILIITILVFVIITYIPATQGIFDKFSIMEEEEDMTNGRQLLWQTSIDIWEKNPILGVGANSLNKTYGLSSHNVFLQVLAEMGIIGFISLISLLLSVTVKSYRINKHIQLSDFYTTSTKAHCASAFYMEIVFLVYCFFGNPIYNIFCILPYTMFYTMLKSYESKETAL